MPGESRGRGAGALLGIALLLPSRVPPLAAQDLTRERAEYADWLATAPFSPYAAVAMQPIGAGLVLGPMDADVPLAGVAGARIIEERGALYLEQNGTRRGLPRNRPAPLGGYHLLATGTPGRTLLLVYATPRNVKSPAYYPPAPDLSFVVPLDPPERRGAFRTLGLDGIESDAREAGFVTLPLGGRPAKLRVYRVGNEDDAELLVFFRDSTNGRGSYPAGRFVTLDPAGNGRYRVDLNRARNPFCAYNTVFPCPPPWPGNSIPLAIAAGERYQASH
jgi:Protein of unknown function (DUF1684)